MGSTFGNLSKSLIILVIPALEVTKVSHLFIVFPLCPSGESRPRSCQNVAVYTKVSLFIVIFALEATKVLLFVAFPPPRPAQVVIPALEVNKAAKASMFIVFPPAQVVIPALGVTVSLLFVVVPPCPGGNSRP